MKKIVMLVFLGPKRSWEFFWVFRKKSKKSEKMRFFRKKAYGLRSTFVKYRITIYHKKFDNLIPKKMSKKKGISFFETFFLKWKLDIYFCPFLKLKKKFWKMKNFPFSPSRWIYSVKWRVIMCIFAWLLQIFVKTPENYQKIPEKCNSHKKIWNCRFGRIFL